MPPAVPLPAVAPWSAEATVASEYISKGVGRSDGQPHVALQAQRHLPGRTYAGVWVGSLRSPLGADGEAQFHYGWRPNVGGWSFDLRPTYKILLNARNARQTSQWEFRADATRPIAGARLRLRLEQAPDGYGPARASTWAEAQLSRKFAPGWSAAAALGRREQQVGVDYTAWSLGVQRDLGRGLALDLRWVDTNRHAAGAEARGRVVGALVARF